MRGFIYCLLLTVASVSAQGPNPPCVICGVGFVVGNPNAEFSFPGQPSVMCGSLEDAGLNGQIPADSCQFLPDLVFATCECMAVTLPPSLAPILPPAFSNSPSMFFLCDVCGPDMEVANPDGLFEFPGQRE